MKTSDEINVLVDYIFKGQSTGSGGVRGFNGFDRDTYQKENIEILKAVNLIINLP